LRDQIIKVATKMPVLHLKRRIADFSEPLARQGITVRRAEFPGELKAWATLREIATADLVPKPGHWTVSDVQRELIADSERQIVKTWVAELAISPQLNDGKLAGSVSLLIRRQGCAVSARIHWLLVNPAMRRQGIGRLLMATAEQACLEAGIRQISLETHRNWTAAVAFYRALGYA
jgi:ribosomal protein S18 acetylase RimI-like enzyme